MDDKKKMCVALSASLIIVSIIALVSLAYNFIGGFYQSRIVKFNKTIGQQLTITIAGEGSYVESCNFTGTTLLDTDTKQIVLLKGENFEPPLYLRAKAVVGDINTLASIFGYTNWIPDPDSGYIYFNQEFQKNENVGLCQYVRLDGKMELSSNKNYILNFVVECQTTPYERLAELLDQAEEAS